MKRQHATRGAALVETAFVLVPMLVVLYCITWGVRVGTVLERDESSVRYAGVLSQQQNPYFDYSLYSVYNNLGATSNVPTQPCVPPGNLFVTGGALPQTAQNQTSQNATVAPFWLPDLIQPSCDNKVPVRQNLSGATRNFLILVSAPQMQSTVSDSIFGSALNIVMTSSQRFFRSPDMSTVMHCVPALNTIVTQSLTAKSVGTTGPTPPMTAASFTAYQAPPAVSAVANCTGSVPVVPPSPAPYNPNPGVTPNPANPTPGNPGSSSAPSAAPTAAPTAAPPTAKPTATPVPPPTPTPGPPTATPKPTATPVPTATPKPTVPPTATPKPTPKPTATPGPPGSIF